MATNDWLPPLMEFNDYGGDWESYLTAIYAAFRTDFIASSPFFRGRRLGLKRHPVIQGKEATFWHLISEGKVEENRTPDFRRCERIRWPKPVIEHESEPEILVWIEPRGSNDDRIHIYLTAERYLVVLADRGSYILPWTAYYIQHENGHQKYLQRHARHTQKS
jgi:hypothetical protein